MCSSDAAQTKRSFATGPVDSPPRRINTRPVSKGLHDKGVLRSDRKIEVASEGQITQYCGKIPEIRERTGVEDPENRDSKYC